MSGTIGGFQAPARSLPPAAAQRRRDTIAAGWATYRRAFIASDGRVVDTGNAGISHSEGQSYAMIAAVKLGDRASFDRILAWTNRTLRRRGDSLAAWRYTPRQGVGDRNNATDGDLLLAWALQRAADRWQDSDLAEMAAEIARDILAKCTVEWEGHCVLLPGAAGFEKGDHIVVNASYFIFGAYRALSRLVPDARWARLEASSLAILGASAFGRWGLPADWCVLRRNGDVAIWMERPPRFSWDAMRVPLHLAWAWLPAPALAASVRFWRDPALRHQPTAWTDLRTNEVAPYAGHAGVQAVLQLAAFRAGIAPAPQNIAVSSATDYYGASLVLLAAIAADEAPEAPPDQPTVVPLPGGSAGSLRNLWGLLD